MSAKLFYKQESTDRGAEMRLPDRIRTSPVNWVEIFEQAYSDDMKEYAVREAEHENALIDHLVSKTGIDYDTAVCQLQEQGDIFGANEAVVHIPYFTQGSFHYWIPDKFFPLCKTVAENVAEIFINSKLKPREIRVLMNPGDADHIQYANFDGLFRIHPSAQLTDGTGKELKVIEYYLTKLDDHRYIHHAARTFGSGTFTEEEPSGIVVTMAYRTV